MPALPKLGSWPDHARKTLDTGERAATYYDIAILRRMLSSDAPDDHANALRDARVGDVHIRYPRDGAGTLRVVVRTWGSDYAHWHGSAGGYGYDKRTAAIAGCGASLPTEGGPVPFADHSDPAPGVRWDDDAGWFARGILVQR